MRQRARGVLVPGAGDRAWASPRQGAGPSGLGGGGGPARRFASKRVVRRCGETCASPGVRDFWLKPRCGRGVGLCPRTPDVMVRSLALARMAIRIFDGLQARDRPRTRIPP